MSEIWMAKEAGRAARLQGVAGHANPYTYFYDPDLACAWDDGGAE
jgi:hypothetical protein